jgi:LysM repeat protein
MKSRMLFVKLLLVVLLLATVASVYAQTTYTIQRGDTLYSIATRFGVTVQAIAAANNIVNPNLIYAGQVLVIPDGSSGGGDAPAPAPPSPPAPAPNPPPSSGTYVVKPGDTLFRIAVLHGVTMAAIVQANGIANPNIIYAGQVLTIPGSGSDPGPPPAIPTAVPPPAPPPQAPPPQQPPVSIGPNVLPNASFEEGYYHLNGVPELQVPNHWTFEFDQGQGAPGTGQTYLRPEIRVMPRWLLPPSEQPQFIWNGDWTVKVFKGGSPISFRLLTNVYLEPGTYRFTANYFPDLVSGYSGGRKIYTTQPSAGEVAFVRNGIGGFSPVTPGTKNTMVQTFTVPTAGNVQIGVAFRTRYVLSNNGFFIDDWSLQRVSE